MRLTHLNSEEPPVMRYATLRNMSLQRDILALSSGSMSTILRNAGKAGLFAGFYRYQLCDPVVIDDVQHRLALFAAHTDSGETWVDVWHAYLTALSEVEFVRCYYGCMDYRFRNGCYSVRPWGGPDRIWATGVWLNEVHPTIGTVTVCDAPDVWPDPVAVTVFPGYVPATLDGIVSYHDTFGPPRLREGVDKEGYIHAYADPESDRVYQDMREHPKWYDARHKAVHGRELWAARD